jgi:hypothetical protein
MTTERTLAAALAVVVLLVLPAAVMLTARGAFDDLVGKTYRQSELDAAVRQADRDGYARGETDGYDAGYARGETNGYDTGYDDGGRAGYSDGREDGCEYVFDQLNTTRVIDYWDQFADYGYVSTLSSVQC